MVLQVGGPNRSVGCNLPMGTPFIGRWNNPLIRTSDPNFQRDIQVGRFFFSFFPRPWPFANFQRDPRAADLVRYHPADACTSEHESLKCATFIGLDYLSLHIIPNFVSWDWIIWIIFTYINLLYNISLEPGTPKANHTNGCFNWMMNQIFTEMVVGGSKQPTEQPPKEPTTNQQQDVK